MNLINKAYVNLSEISKDIGMSSKKLRTVLEEKNIKKYDIGYRSSEVISKLKLKDWIYLKESIKKTEQSRSKNNTTSLYEKKGEK